MKCFINNYRLLLLAALMMTTTALWAQSKSDQLFGYRQVTTPGIAAADELENLDGSVEKRSGANNNRHYLIYLSTLSKTRVYPIEVWIRGEAFSAKAQTVTTPVQVAAPAVAGRPQKKTVVPKTTQKVTQLIPLPLMESKSSAKGKTLAGQNELVVVYKQGGKTIYKTLKTLQELSGRPLQ